MDERKACYLLSMADGMGPVSITGIAERAGGYEEAYRTDPEVFLKEKLLNERQVNGIRMLREEERKLLDDYAAFPQSGIRILMRGDEEYPQRLFRLPDPPVLLFVKGSLPDPEKPAAAVIGARECSEYGKKCAEFFSGELSSRGISIISGMAVGIDSAAAEGALRAGGNTFAVLGSGVSVCYPKESYGLYRRLTGEAGAGEYPEGAQHGGVLSEVHPKAPGLAGHFVARNRIIAGLSDVILVIEARERSGTFITVGYGLNIGLEIFSLPGRITDPLGRGCNRLLRDGASPLTEPGDVLSALGIEAEGNAGDLRSWPAERNTADLSRDEKAVYKVLDYNAMHIEDIAYGCRKALRETQQLIRMLEEKGFVVSTGRAYYRRK